MFYKPVSFTKREMRFLYSQFKERHHGDLLY